jgi:hypothetical protein
VPAPIIYAPGKYPVREHSELKSHKGILRRYP